MKRRIIEQLCRVRDELGAMGVAALALFVLAGAFMTLALQPLKEQNRVLAAKADMIDNRAAPGANSGEKLAAVYHSCASPSRPPTGWRSSTPSATRPASSFASQSVVCSGLRR